MKRPWSQHIPAGVPASVDVPLLTIPELLQQSLHTYADHTAITFYHQTYTYRQLSQAIAQFARALQQMGIKKGDRVGIMLPNCPQYPISYYAALQCGATIVQLSPMYKPNELLHVLQDSETSFLIVLDTLLPLTDSIIDQSSVSHTIDVSFSQACTFDQLLHQSNEEYSFTPVPIFPKEDVAVIQYTGGTTGRPKGAMLTHYNIVANAIQSAATSEIKIKKGEERVLTIAPLFHIYGMTGAMILTFYNGGNMILVPKFDVEHVIELIEKVQPTAFPGAPTMYIALLHRYSQKPFDLSCFTLCTSGSAPLPLEVLERFNQLSKADIAEGYGLSEASPVTHRNPVIGLQKAGSIGFPIASTDAKIVDATTGERELPQGEVGELIIQGPQVMKGYWNQPEETAKALRNGWLYTGDLAKMDEDGYFYIVGRKKELIIASGYNVYPIEVEDVLYRHPAIFEAAVIGIPDSYRGETVHAVIVLKEDASLSEEPCISYCREHLATYKVPTSVTFLTEMPKSDVGKILKRKLKELLAVK
ncbi:long-chain fatty acid--CoA ligase [Mechercharimyces sp. CAU 1602]|uniref:long-chain-fatty-acid--CoA ligase n=1 Tax=Mechercharimyces sp. CAU 1602 TaxID=2973933 RepID=UPI0021623962|nr:long-chain fatty acid--CoA ligase [Mechercharimyces sp. CAU 1602]MCS1350722.1 long-chain fatty acid--CoA ligase [Mechercharimyces sp. CAU 1602]